MQSKPKEMIFEFRTLAGMYLDKVRATSEEQARKRFFLEFPEWKPEEVKVKSRPPAY